MTSEVDNKSQLLAAIKHRLIVILDHNLAFVKDRTTTRYFCWQSQVFSMSCFLNIISLFLSGHQRRLPLWLFMITVIKADRKQVCLAWTDTDRLEFTVKDRDLLAHVWGLVKGNVSMDYAKLSRALRYYYGKRIIEKVSIFPFVTGYLLEL